MFHNISQPLQEDTAKLLSEAGFKTPTSLQEQVVPAILQGKNLTIETSDGEGKTLSYLLPILLKPPHPSGTPAALILTEELPAVRKTERQYRRFSRQTRLKPVISLGHDENAKKELRLLSRHPFCIIGPPVRIIDHIRRENLILDDLEAVVIDIPDMPYHESFDHDILFILSKISKKCQVIVYTKDIEELGLLAEGFKRFHVISGKATGNSDSEDRSAMGDKKESNPEFEETIFRELESIKRRVRESEDPLVLNRYKKIFKRAIPFHLRGYIAAYLVKNMPRDESFSDSPAGDMSTLFVSMGKNRKVFPRDLTKLFQSALKSDENFLGNIKVLDNYSFVDIKSSKAQAAIDALNGKDFRGRQITVNHARKKDKK